MTVIAPEAPTKTPPTTPKHPDKARFPRPPLWLLAMLTFTGPSAMHIFVPALPSVAHDLATNAHAVQFTITFYITGLAIGQLVIGPLSDRYGRRPVLMAGLVLYTVASLMAALAPNIPLLLAARLFQAFGGCAGLVLGRTIARDGVSQAEAVRRLALLNLIIVIGPAVAPIIGGAMAAFVGWRYVLALLCVFGTANLFLTWRLVQETADTSQNRTMAVIMREYFQLLRTPAFVGFALGGGCSTTAIYAFFSAAPFIFIGNLHRTMQEVGIYLAMVLFGAWLGSLVASRVVRPAWFDRMIIQGNLICIAGVAIMLIAVLTDHLSVVLVVATMMMFLFGAGLSSPAVLSRSVNVNPKIAGSASGLYGFAQMAVAAICTALVGIGDDPALAAGIVLLGASLIGQAALWIAIRASRRMAAEAAGE